MAAFMAGDDISGPSDLRNYRFEDQLRRRALVPHLEAVLEPLGKAIVVAAQPDPRQLVPRAHLVAEARPRLQGDAVVDFRIGADAAGARLDQEHPDLAGVDAGEPPGPPGAERALHRREVEAGGEQP